MPVFGTSAATFNDNGVTALYQHLAGLLAGHGLHLAEGVLPAAVGRTSTGAAPVIPPARTGYLAEIAETVRGYHAETARQAGGGAAPAAADRRSAALSWPPASGWPKPAVAAPRHAGRAGRRQAEQAADAGQRRAARGLAGRGRSRTRATSRSSGSATGSCAPS